MAVGGDIASVERLNMWDFLTLLVYKQMEGEFQKRMADEANNTKRV